MKIISDASLSTVFRFGLTGFVAFTVFAIVPITVFSPTTLHSLSEFGGAIGVIIFSVASGFVIDGLKLYQLSCGYEKNRDEFNKAVADALDVDMNQAPVYFAKAAQIERNIGLGYIDFLHSRWVTFDVCAKVFFGSSMLWGIIAISCWFTKIKGDCAILLLLFSLGCLVLSLRLFCTAQQERIRASASYINFCRRHRQLIVGSDLIDLSTSI